MTRQDIENNIKYNKFEAILEKLVDLVRKMPLQEVQQFQEKNEVARADGIQDQLEYI